MLRTKALRTITTVHECKPISRGLLAGITAAEENLSFADAYEKLGIVDPSLLHDYERDLWSQERRKIVMATREISVIDADGDGPHRILVRNSQHVGVSTVIGLSDPYLFR